MSNDILSVARDYIARGWSPVPIGYRQKKPIADEWQHQLITAKNVAKFFNGARSNIGVQLGPKSGGLADVDLDCAEALNLARHFLPATRAIFGRKSAPAAHHLYVVNDPDPVTVIQHHDDNKGMIVELRLGADKGAQTVFPGSQHEETGELIEWVKNGEPARIPFKSLDRAVRNIAVASLLLRHYPAEGSRHNLALRVGGFLARAGYGDDEIGDLIEVVAHEAGDPEVSDRRRAAANAVCALADDKHVYGLPALREFLGEKVANAIGKIVGYLDELMLDPKNPMLSARVLVKANFTTAERQTLYRHRGAFWQWTGAYYQLADDETIRSVIWAFLEQAKRMGDKAPVPFKPMRERVGNVLDALGAVSQLDKYIEPPVWLKDGSTLPPPHEFLACANGLLHLPTGKMYQPTANYFGLGASDVVFDSKASVPMQWLAFLEQLFGDDQQAIRLLQEWFGYSLAPDTSQQKILLMVGPKRSGKGTIARIQRALLGATSVGGPTMASLGEQFGLEPLITKTLAIVSDARIGARTDKSQIVERLLSISGEDALSVPRKFRQSWDGQLKARFMILTNELPSLTDGSGALAGRFVVLILTNSFFGKEDPGLTGKLLTELSGILNWAIDGYRRLRKRGHFLMPKSALEAVEHIELLGAPVKAFVQACCKVGPGLTVKVDDLWTAFELHSQSEGRRDYGSKEWFGRNLRSAEPGITLSRPRVKGSREQTYIGIALNQASEELTANTFAQHGLQLKR